MPDENRPLNILAIFAHPDDETMITGGTLALLASQGARVTFLSATRGEGGENGDPPVCTIEELGTVRSDELRCAVAALGGAGLEFLGYVDPRVGPEDELFPYTTDLDRLVEQIKEAVIRLQADAVFTHGSSGEYGHPAHLITHQAVLRALQGLGERAPLMYTAYAAYPDHPRPRSMNRDDPAHLIIDLTPVLDRKIAAALCHTSQNALFVRRPSQTAGRAMTVPEIVLVEESIHRTLPPVDGRVEDAVAGLLRQTGFAREGSS